MGGRHLGRPGGQRSCLGFRLGGAARADLSGLACGARASPIEPAALDCLIDRLSATRAGVGGGSRRGAEGAIRLPPSLPRRRGIVGLRRCSALCVRPAPRRSRRPSAIVETAMLSRCRCRPCAGPRRARWRSRRPGGRRPRSGRTNSATPCRTSRSSRSDWRGPCRRYRAPSHGRAHRAPCACRSSDRRRRARPKAACRASR